MKKSPLKNSPTEPTGIIVTNETQLTAIINRAVALALANGVPVEKKEELMDIDEVAKFLGISRYTILSHTSSGTIPFFKAPGTKKLFFSRSAIENWIKSK